MGHRRFLPVDDKFCCSKKAFNREIEMRPPPILRCGIDLLDQMEALEVTFGKHPITLQRKKKDRG